MKEVVTFPREGPLNDALERMTETIQNEFPDTSIALVMLTPDNWTVRRVIYAKDASGMTDLLLLGSVNYLRRLLERELDA